MIKMTLQQKGIPVPLMYQPIYKLIMFLGILRYSTKGSYGTHLIVIHIYLWSIKSEENYKILEDLSNNKRPSLVPWSYENNIDKVINLAVINRFCKRDVSGLLPVVKLTESGMAFLAEIEKLGVFNDDLGKIKSLGVIPKSKIEAANKKWALK